MFNLYINPDFFTKEQIEAVHQAANALLAKFRASNREVEALATTREKQARQNREALLAAQEQSQEKFRGQRTPVAPLKKKKKA